MPVSRTAPTPLTNDDDIVRRAALLAFVQTPTPDGARDLIDGLLHWLKRKPAIAEEFIAALSQPQGFEHVRGPATALILDADPDVRGVGALLVYRVGPVEAGRGQLEKLLLEDPSPFARAYAGKALAQLGGPSVHDKLAEAIDAEATLDAISRLGEALALHGDPRAAEVLADQAAQLEERNPPPNFPQPVAAWHRTLKILGVALRGLGARPASRPERWMHTTEVGSVEWVGGEKHGGFAGKVTLAEGVIAVLPQDSGQLLRHLGIA